MGLIFLRHTRPQGSDGRCYGATDLLPGPDLANEVRRLSAQLPVVASIVTSPLARCKRLADALAAARKLPVRTETRLMELDFGTWEGRAWNDIPRAEIDLWAADLMDARPHGGESVAMLAARVEGALADLPQDTLVVTHMGVIRAALARAGRHDAWQAKLPFGHWLEI